jgi:DNA-binding NarL/FixJ family response regulator
MTASARIFFVDDEPSVIAGLRRNLRSWRNQWDMEFFGSSPEALEAIRDNPCTVLVSDLSMPDMTGLQLAHAAKAIAPGIQIIILTGTADLKTAIQAINESDIFRFYTKPCPSEDLAAGIKAAIRDMPEQKSSANLQGRGIGEAALAKLPLGVVVVDKAGHVDFMNPRAAEIVTGDDGLFVSSEGTLRARKATESNAIHDLVARVLETGDAGDSGAIAIERPSMLRPLSVLVSPLAEETGPARAVLFLTDPEAQPSISASIIGELFGLTDSESRLARALAEGRRLDEAAETIGVTVSSARTYLKQVFSKTETSRQAELVQLILTSPAILEGGRTAAPPD